MVLLHSAEQGGDTALFCCLFDRPTPRIPRVGPHLPKEARGNPAAIGVAIEVVLLDLELELEQERFQRERKGTTAT
jgi:hypothetical protein